VLPPTHFAVDAHPKQATYGSLLTAATENAALASTADSGPFLTPEQALDTMADYERFLSSAGRHLILLLDCRSGPHDPSQAMIRQIATDLAGLRDSRRGTSAWANAADQLRCAHDLLAGHVGSRGESRSPDAHLLAKPRAMEAAVVRILDLSATPIDCFEKLRTESRIVQVSTDPPPNAGAMEPLGQVVGRVRHLMAGVPRPTETAPLRAIDALTPARTQFGAESEPADLGTGLQAFQLLRQLAFGQANGRVPANAHTVQELCALGAVTCRAAEDLLPEPSTDLRRLDHAMAIDHLRRASTLWRAAGGRLYPRVQGLTRAPHVYHDAVHAVLDETQENRTATRTVLACLPGLAAQAATTINTLRARNELVTCQQPARSSSPSWLPIDPATGQRLTDSLIAAGRATLTANTALRRQLSQRRQVDSLTQAAVVRARSRSRELTR
jgi:hypothetical protein